MTSITRSLAYVYVIVCGWTGVAVTVEWLTVPTIVLCVVAISFLLCIFWTNVPYDDELFGTEDIFLSVMLVFWLTSALVNPNEKSLYYVALYLFSFGLGYSLLKLIFFGCTNIKGLMYANLVGVTASACFAGLDALLFHLSSIDLQLLIPRVKEATAFFGGLFRRSYGLAPEPTVLAYYLNAMSPLAIWFLWVRTDVAAVTKTVLTAIVFLALVTTLSIAGYLFLIAALTGTVALRAAVRSVETTRYSPRRSGRLSTPYVMLGAIALVGLAAGITVQIVDVSSADARNRAQLVDPLIQKVSFGKSGSAQARLDRWDASIVAISEDPLFGKGAGYFSSRNQSSSINWYLFLGAESGLLAFCAGVLFIGFGLWRIATSGVEWKWAALIGGVAGALHFGVIATIQNPALWTLLALCKAGILIDKQSGQSLADANS